MAENEQKLTIKMQRGVSDIVVTTAKYGVLYTALTFQAGTTTTFRTLVNHKPNVNLSLELSLLP